MEVGDESFGDIVFECDLADSEARGPTGLALPCGDFVAVAGEASLQLADFVQLAIRA